MNLGKSFSDFISVGYTSKRKKTLKTLFSERQSPSWRPFFLFVFLVVAFFLIQARLFHLTIVEGSRHRALSESNRVKEVIIFAPRGIIFDRFGKPLVHNVPDGRYYPYGDAFSHLLGYVGEPNSDELAELNRDCPGNSFCKVYLGEKIGRGGVEEAFDNLLRGVSGRELIEVDAYGETLRILGRIEPKKGENLHLSIDEKLQLLAASQLDGLAGSIIVANPQNGKLLALYSSPSFDPNLFAQGKKEASELLAQVGEPLFNRAISGLYPPGSTFKIISAVAALEEGKIDEQTQIEDAGPIVIGPYQFNNWLYTRYGRTEGFLNIVKAIARSNDIFFYRLAELVGIEKLASWAKRFKVGEYTAFDLPGESKGLMPDPWWKEKIKKEPWFLGDSYHVAIGQGSILVTPLQVNLWTDVIANNGKLCKPTVISHQCQDLGLKKETITLIKEGMKRACQPGGTGWPLFNFKVKNENLKIDGKNFLLAKEATISGQAWVEIPVACKTGTAEYGDPDDKTHAWFTAFAPVEDAEISVTVLVEGGGEGSSVAGPIAKRLLEEWFSR